MGSQPSEAPRRQEGSSSAPSIDPEALARLVLRCREFKSYLDELAPRLPRREETPFLYGQLDDAARKLHSSIARFAALEEGERDERGGLLRLLSTKKRRPQPSTEPRIDLQGNAWTIPVTELVNFLSHSGKSGVLWVTTSLETFLLEFNRGNLVHATSSATPREFRLGEILLREKLLDATELELKLQNARSADDLLGSFLVRSGRLTPQQLQRALSIQVQELFHRLMDADNAIYRFQDGVQMLRAQELAVNITQLLLESARKKDEQRQAREALASPAPSPTPAAAKPERAPPPAEAPAEEPEEEEPDVPEAPTAVEASREADDESDGGSSEEPDDETEPAPALPLASAERPAEPTATTSAVPRAEKPDRR